MKLADKVLIPLQPSIFDIHATHEFVDQLLAHRRSSKVQAAVVGMRTREGTISTDQLALSCRKSTLRCSASCATPRTTSISPLTA